MSENPENENPIAEEFRNLGINLMNTMRAAWESPERKKLQGEIEEGLTALAATIKMEANTFTESPTGQRLKNDLDEWAQRVRSGEAEGKAREEIIRALKLINTELEKVTNRWPGQSEDAPSQPVNPPPSEPGSSA